MLRGAPTTQDRNLHANINFPFEIKGTKPDRVWIDELLNRVGLEGFGARFPRELSGGMQQRAALVRALSYRPSVLLMDEPFGALDAFTREEMNRLVEEIWLDTRTTIVLITHSIDEALEVGDRIMVLHRPARIAFEAKVSGTVTPERRQELRARILDVLGSEAGRDGE